ncbi:inactive protein kinase, partial [Tanacetum coccineum]
GSSSTEGNMGKAEKVVVAVKASKEIRKTALVWALTHVVQPGHCITLLVVSSSQSHGRKLWGFPRFTGDCASVPRKVNSGTSSDPKVDITDSCSQMILQLHDVYDPNKVNVKIKLVSATPCGVVAAEAKKLHASWVVLDKDLKHEKKSCMEELQCSVVVMKKSKPEYLRVSFVESVRNRAITNHPSVSETEKSSEKHQHKKTNKKNKESSQVSVKKPVDTPTSSPELFTTTEPGTSSVSSSDTSQKKELFIKKQNREHDDESSSDSENENLSSSSCSLRFQPSIVDIVTSSYHLSQYGLFGKFSKLDHETNTKYHGSVRDVISFSRNTPSGPPPLCSICLNKAPIVGKPPRWFTYAELELATGGFSRANFLAEGGFGSVHRGVLNDGQVVAVKQHKLASTQGDQEFCSEVEVLSCAQHRNVVMLIGFCVEDGRRLLVYEYICNRSLDYHLYGRHKDTLEWSARLKIAVGAARGLRYLHEECRVGCIVHRDVRPNNILITHDFEPMVGDFGLARWQPDGDKGEATRVIGTFGYLAPEYAESGQITEKADVYSFGVVLVELVTGRKAVDLNRPKGQQSLTEWARPLLDGDTIDELIDPRLGNCYSEDEVICMLQAASLCIKRDPYLRPRMSQVIRILEGDLIMESSHMSSPRCEVSNQNDRRWSDHTQYNGSPLSKSLERLRGKLPASSRVSHFVDK